MITEADIRKAYTTIRTIDNTIPDNVLDFIKNSSIKQLNIASVNKCNIYGFKVGEMTIDIEADTEKKAIIKLINEYWELIDKDGKIELYGLLKKVKD